MRLQRRQSRTLRGAHAAALSGLQRKLLRSCLRRRAHCEGHHAGALGGHEDVGHGEQPATPAAQLLPAAPPVQMVHALRDVARQLDVRLLVVPHGDHLGLHPWPPAVSALGDARPQDPQACRCPGSLRGCLRARRETQAAAAQWQAWGAQRPRSPSGRHLVEQHVCRHQHRVRQQPSAHVLALRAQGAQPWAGLREWKGGGRQPAR